MKTLAELRLERAEVVKSMDALTKADDWTDEKRTEFDELKARADELDTDIARLEDVEARKVHLAQPAPTNDPPPVIGIGDAPEDRTFDTFGEQLGAIHRAAVGGYEDPRLTEERAVSGHSEGVPADGGFLVQSDFAAAIFQIAHDGAQFLPRCRTTPVSGNGLTMNVIDESSRVAGSRWGGVLAYWKPEAGTATAKKVKFAQMEWKLRKLIAISYATDELLADTGALGPVVSQAFAEEIAFMVDDALIRGDGAANPLGIENSACFVSQAIESGQVADTIVFENFVKMWARLHARSQPNAVWMINQNCLPQIMLMTLDVGTGGVPVYMPPGGASGAPYGTIFGRPVLVTEFSDKLGEANDVMLGDWSQYQVITKGGLNSAVSAHVKFAEDEMAFRFTYRIDGQPLWKSALTPYKGGSGATQSPFIGLAERA
jgi:HK97 family phage major capsid protein